MQKHRMILTAAMVFAAAAAPFAAGQDAAAPKTQPAAAAPAPKAEPTLKVGDKAPQLMIEKWVKGDQVTGYEKGRVYVIEFWATWCGPCIASMPHLTHLQKEYKDKVQIIGVTTMDKNNSLEQVEAMVKDKGEEGMGYSVAWDDGTKTKEALFKAAGQGGIPCSFVVDGNGTIAYIGHPMWLDGPLAQITKGTWDIEKGMAQIKEAGEKLTSISKMAASDPKGALAALKELETQNPAISDVMGSMKFSLLLKADSAESRAEARQMLTKISEGKDAAKIGSMARMLGADPKAEAADLDLALTAARRAVDLTDKSNAAMMTTLASVYFKKGDKAAAVEWQKKAIAAAPEARKAPMEKTLAEYEGK